jgi:hypothetical protein
MAITRWDPFGEMMTLTRDMDRLMSRMGLRGNLPTTSGAIAWMPRVDVRRHDDDPASWRDGRWRYDVPGCLGTR